MLFREVSKCKGTRKEQLFLAGGLGMEMPCLIWRSINKAPEKEQKRKCVFDSTIYAVSEDVECRNGISAQS